MATVVTSVGTPRAREVGSEPDHPHAADLEDGTQRGQQYVHRWDDDMGQWRHDVLPDGIADSRNSGNTPRFADDGGLETYAILADESGETGGDFYRFERSGGEWSGLLIAASPEGSAGWRPVGTIRNATDEFPALIGEWHADSATEGLRFMGWGSIGQTRLAVDLSGQ